VVIWASTKRIFPASCPVSQGTRGIKFPQWPSFEGLQIAPNCLFFFFFYNLHYFLFKHNFFFSFFFFFFFFSPFFFYPLLFFSPISFTTPFFFFLALPFSSSFSFPPFFFFSFFFFSSLSPFSPSGYGNSTRGSLSQTARSEQGRIFWSMMTDAGFRCLASLRFLDGARIAKVALSAPAPRVRHGAT